MAQNVPPATEDTKTSSGRPAPGRDTQTASKRLNAFFK